MNIWIAAFAMLAGAAAVPADDIVIPGHFTLGRQPDGNTVVFDGKDGLVVVDTGRHPQHQAEILALAEKRAKPIVAIVNTHWHLDHSGGNAEVRAAFPRARLYASEAVSEALDGFLARSLIQGQARLDNPGLPEAQKAEVRLDLDAIRDRRNLLPDRLVTAAQRLPLKGRKLRLFLAEHAATRGDVWLYDPESATLVAGDLVVLPAPFFDTACPERWSAALADLAAIPFRTLVPGHGPTLSRSDFELYRKAFDALLACARSQSEAQICTDSWLRDAAPLLATEQDHKAAEALLAYYLGTVLRSEAKQREFCPV